MSNIVDCPRCLGTREEFDGERMETCSKCHGTGTFDRTLEEGDEFEDNFKDDIFLEFDDNLDYGINEQNIDLDDSD